MKCKQTRETLEKCDMTQPDRLGVFPHRDDGWHIGGRVLCDRHDETSLSSECDGHLKGKMDGLTC
jgi:hypothetical protein